MEWAKFKLPLPVFQQEESENCIDFLKRIQNSLEETNSEMTKEDSVFWFLLGVKEDVIQKIPFNPEESLWIDPDNLETDLALIDQGVRLDGPFRTGRFQNAFNFFICYRCGHWGHRSMNCRWTEPEITVGRALKRKISELSFEEETKSKSKKKSGSAANDYTTSSNQHSDSNERFTAETSHEMNSQYSPGYSESPAYMDKKQPQRRNSNSNNSNTNNNTTFNSSDTTPFQNDHVPSNRHYVNSSNKPNQQRQQNDSFKSRKSNSFESKPQSLFDSKPFSSSSSLKRNQHNSNNSKDTSNFHKSNAKSSNFKSTNSYTNKSKNSEEVTRISRNPKPPNSFTNKKKL